LIYIQTGQDLAQEESSKNYISTDPLTPARISEKNDQPMVADWRMMSPTTADGKRV
jgi:hypothetical protein